MTSIRCAVIHNLIDDMTHIPGNRKITLKVLGRVSGLLFRTSPVNCPRAAACAVRAVRPMTRPFICPIRLGFVIRAASATRYGDKAMHAVNQGTATFIRHGGRRSGYGQYVRHAKRQGTLRAKYKQTTSAIEDSVVVGDAAGVWRLGWRLWWQADFLRCRHVPYVWGGTTTYGLGLFGDGAIRASSRSGHFGAARQNSNSAGYATGDQRVHRFSLVLAVRHPVTLVFRLAMSEPINAAGTQ